MVTWRNGILLSCQRDKVALANAKAIEVLDHLRHSTRFLLTPSLSIPIILAMKKGVGWPLCLLLIAGLCGFASTRVNANSVEVDWTSGGFSPSQITINAGDEVDIVNFDDTFDLLVTGAPPESFYSDIPATDGIDVYYLPYVYNHPGTFSFSDEFGNSVTVTVNAAVPPLSVAITAPTNNATFTAPATFSITATPSGGATPYAQIQFYVGSSRAGVAYNSPFTNTVTSLSAGSYTISAVVTDNNSATATSSINVTVSAPPTTQTNYILPVCCADIYSSGSVLTNAYLSTGGNIHGGLEFAAFNANRYTSVLLELNPYGLPLFGTNVSVYGFDGGTGTLVGSNYNSGTLIGIWTLPSGLGYGQIATYDVTAFVKSTKGPYFGFILQAGPDDFSSTSINYGTPPELFAIGPPLPPMLTLTKTGNQLILSWSTNNSAGLSLKSTATLGPGASWNPVGPAPALVGNQWVVTNSVSGASQFFRLSNQ